MEFIAAYRNLLLRATTNKCGELQHGEIARLKVQDGLPVLTEVAKRVRFAK